MIDDNICYPTLKYKNGIGAKEIVQKIRDYVKKYSDYTFSITLDKCGWTPDIKVSLVSGNKDITKDGTIEELKQIIKWMERVTTIPEGSTP